MNHVGEQYRDVLVKLGYNVINAKRMTPNVRLRLGKRDDVFKVRIGYTRLYILPQADYERVIKNEKLRIARIKAKGGVVPEPERPRKKPKKAHVVAPRKAKSEWKLVRHANMLACYRKILTRVAYLRGGDN